MKTRLVADLYVTLCRVHPGFRKWTRRWMYRLMARAYRAREWTFMNYGYAPLDGQPKGPSLEASDEPNRYCIQLYHHVAAPVDLAGADVLEVGSGRGGGAAYLRRYHGPGRVVGVDFSAEAVAFCRATHRVDGLHFVAGDAERLPFRAGCFDAVVNVESSHCYSSMGAFLGQVWRVLRSGGVFLFADFRDVRQLDALDAQLDASRMAVERTVDITPNALRALDLDAGRRLALIRRIVPSFMVKPACEFAGIEGSGIYDRFRLGVTVYRSYVLRKA